jgi:hypothetical protein
MNICSVVAMQTSSNTPQVSTGLSSRTTGLRARRDPRRHPVRRIIYVRPGHISAGFVLAVIDALRTSSVEVEPPFVAVAERQESTVRVRVRTAPPW